MKLILYFKPNIVKALQQKKRDFPINYSTKKHHSSYWLQCNNTWKPIIFYTTIVLVLYDMLMLTFCIIILMYVYEKERKKDKIREEGRKREKVKSSVWQCAVVCMHIRLVCVWERWRSEDILVFLPQRSCISMNVMYWLVLTRRRLALIKLHELGM